jgi:putative alpha-1,2-mannosidase
LTATERTGWQRYTFPATGQANVLFNVGKADQSVQNSEIHIVGDRTIEGRGDAGGFCAGNDRHTVYFSATFDRRSPRRALGAVRRRPSTTASRSTPLRCRMTREWRSTRSP